MNYISNNTRESKEIARNLASNLKGGEVICLYGELGAGKTVFVQGMLEYLLPGKRVLSPTFIIVRHYKVNHKIIKYFIHVDLYRTSNIKEIKDLEFFEFIHKPDSIVAIEWAEKLGNLLPEKKIDIDIKNIDENKRIINIHHVKS